MTEKELKTAKDLYEYIVEKSAIFTDIAEFSAPLADLLDDFEPKATNLYTILLDLMGVPEDNTVETNACNRANETGKWPKEAFCRDGYLNALLGYVPEIQSFDDFLKACEEASE